MKYHKFHIKNTSHKEYFIDTLFKNVYLKLGRLFERFFVNAAVMDFRVYGRKSAPSVPFFEDHTNLSIESKY